MKKIFFTGIIAIFGILMVQCKVNGQSLINFKKKDNTITVGGTNSDIPGFTNRAIQMAVDALPSEGGSILLSPGKYIMMAPVCLKSNVKLIGAGDETILTRIDGFNSKMIIDADYGELKATVEDPSGFKVGMSIQITDGTNRECWDVTTAIITNIEGDTIYFDNYLIRDYKSTNKGVISNAGSCVLVEEAHYVSISNLKIDGNKNRNDLLDGCNGGGIAILKSKSITVDNVNVIDFNGEGITWQITDSVSILNCKISGCTNMGMHPGSGSPHTLIQNTKSNNNKVGLFLCWRVNNSVVKESEFYNNTEYGISTGHKDVDVVFDNNHIYMNGIAGVVFRNELPANSPHRNVFTNNIVEDNGITGEGFGFLFTGNARNILLKNNIIRNSVNGKQKAPISISNKTPSIELKNNKISGHRLGNGIYTESIQ